MMLGNLLFQLREPIPVLAPQYFCNIWLYLYKYHKQKHPVIWHWCDRLGCVVVVYRRRLADLKHSVLSQCLSGLCCWLSGFSYVSSWKEGALVGCTVRCCSEVLCRICRFGCSYLPGFCTTVSAQILHWRVTLHLEMFFRGQHCGRTE